MKTTMKAIITLLLLVLVTTACAPRGGNVSQPTPNLTLTALFNPVSTVPATVTPIYVVVTNTPQPTIQPTNTTQPTNTVIPPTATTAPTNTVAATAVPPMMGQRGYLMYASKINFTPTIDGTWEDWKDYTTQYPVAYVVYGKSNWTGKDDLLASYAAVWDADYLYIGVKVHDDIYSQPSTGENLYKGDSVELLVDSNLSGDYYTQALNSDDYQIGLSAGADGVHPEAYRWFPIGKAGSLSNVDIAWTSETGLWRLEARIPWSKFGITPYKGMHIGFAVSVNDDDLTTPAQQTMVSSAPYRSLVDPTTWGELVLN